ncbi:MAG: hypothetical protein FIA99_14045 [Ruminiclostridium sp.]|nr:hypothetical protein [Ruminiclostridium sp.]
MNIKELEKLSTPNWLYNVKDQLRQYIYDLSESAFASGDEARDEIINKEQLAERKNFVRSRFIEAIGGIPGSGTPLNPQIKGIVRDNGFRIEKIIYESRPGAYVTANLYMPDNISSPTGAVLFLSGHHEHAKHAEEYQVVCRYLVNAGLVVLAQDPVGQGERFSYYENSIEAATINWGVPEHDYAGFQCLPLGDAMARYFVHDAMRGIDYLCTRPEVDPGKIGVTGHSGGGTQTCLMMLCDPRLAAAAPGTFLMNRRAYMYSGGAQDSEQIWKGASALGIDHEDVLLMMAPKPVLVLAAKHDFFPIEGTRRSVQRAEKFWEMHDRAGDLELFEDDVEHMYSRLMAEKAAGFFARHLSGKNAPTAEKQINPIEPSRLWCTKCGQIRCEYDDARFVHDDNCDRLEQLKGIRNDLDEKGRKEKALSWLKEKVYTDRKICDFNLRVVRKLNVEEFVVSTLIWWSQEGIFNHAYIFRNFMYEDKTPLPVTICIWDGGTTQLMRHISRIRRLCDSGRAVFVLDTSGTGPLTPNPVNSFNISENYGTMYKLSCDLMWLNDSLAALRTFDVLRALDVISVLPGIDPNGMDIFAYGRKGIYGQLAAVFDERIKEITVAEGIGSLESLVKSKYYDNQEVLEIIIPEILKHFDLPDVNKWIGETRNINIIGGA